MASSPAAATLHTNGHAHPADVPDPLILFDGVCNLCNGAVNFVIDHDPNARFTFGALQSLEAKPILNRYGVAADYLDSLVLIEDGVLYQKSAAALRVARHLSGAWALLSAFLAVPAPLRDVVYDWIASNRYDWFGKRDSCRMPSPELQERFLEEVA